MPEQDQPAAPAGGGTEKRREPFRAVRLPRRIRSAWAALTLPAAVIFLFHHRVHPGYELSWPARMKLALRMYRNTQRVFTGTSYKAHLAMAAKLLEMPPGSEGDVVECGCFRGGSTANLSLVCRIVGRRLIVFDSFEGLPAPTPGDRYANDRTEGFLKAGLDEVRANVEKYGAIEVCEFRKGWFADTLPGLEGPVALCFLDVDYQASLHDCVLNLWPLLTERGYMFIDEYVFVDYCALFFSERYWRTYFDSDPPGLIGAGSGIGLGQFYPGPYRERTLLQAPGSIAYTRRDFSGLWDYYPEG